MDTRDPKIGVFLCRCGTNIAGTVDMDALEAFTRDLPHVSFVDVGRWICSVDYLNQLKEAVAEQGLERAVVACCTPRTHEPTFKSAVKEAGLNPYLLEFVSIREQVSWVHKHDLEAATDKAKDLVKAGVAKARFLEPAEEMRIPVGRDALVIGGGPAGMEASLSLARQNLHVTLVEKTDRLGGLLNDLHTLTPSGEEAEVVRSRLASAVEEHPAIDVFTSCEVDDLKGYVGNYTVVLSNGQEMPVSTVVTATGMREIDATGLYGFGDLPAVITQLELDRRLRSGKVGNLGNLVMIQCAGSRNESRGCCHIGCAAAIKNARALHALSPHTQITILYRDLTLLGDEVHLSRDAAVEDGIRFIRFSADQPPAVSEKDGSLLVTVRDLLLDRELSLEADQVVLTTALTGDESVDRLRGLLKVSSDHEGFFKEAHIKLRPLDFPADGVYLAGCARSPKPLRETLEEAQGAAMRAAIPMTRGYVEAEGIVAVIDLEACSGCGLCAKECPYGAIEMEEKIPVVIQAVCKGCGTCAAGCPKDAVQIVHYTDEQILAQVDALTEENADQKIVAFFCHWCAMGAVDIAGVSRFEYPPHVRILRVMCSARVDGDWVLHALERGAAGVLVAGCEFPTCHYITGNYECEKRMKRTVRKLEKKGFDPNRLMTAWLSAAQGPKLVKTVEEFTRRLGLTE